MTDVLQSQDQNDLEIFSSSSSNPVQAKGVFMVTLKMTRSLKVLRNHLREQCNNPTNLLVFGN